MKQGGGISVSEGKGSRGVVFGELGAVIAYSFGVPVEVEAMGTYWL